MSTAPFSSNDNSADNKNTQGNSTDYIAPNEIPLTAIEYNQIRALIGQLTGIELGQSKFAMVSARLRKRLVHYHFDSYSQYIRLVKNPREVAERQMLIDLLTTNETYFFRENSHFVYMREHILPRVKATANFRVWSAASSSGEEAYSAAMVLADYFKERRWEVFGSDINNDVLQKARSGHYVNYRLESIPKEYLKKYCLKGKGEYANTILMDRSIKSFVTFGNINLVQPLLEIGLFDVIFLRNALIYFDDKTKRKIIHNIYPALVQGGYLFIGHSESIKGFHPNLEYIAPTIYRKKSP